MLPGTPARASHDYVRHGTSSLYAALDLATGKVIGSLHARHRAQEFLAFLKKIDAEVPADLDCHVVLDNASTHKTPAVKRWLTAHPRFVLHFTPTSCIVAQPRRTLVRRADHQEATSRHPHLGATTQRRHPHLDPNLERQPAALRLDQDRRANPRIRRQLLPTN